MSRAVCSMMAVEDATLEGVELVRDGTEAQFTGTTVSSSQPHTCGDSIHSHAMDVVRYDSKQDGVYVRS
jgi:hypothetical protein